MGMTTYKARKAAGLCVGCGGAPEPGRTKCRLCREKANASRKRVRAETAPPVRVCKQIDKGSGQRRDLCKHCQVVPRPPGKSLCDACRVPPGVRRAAWERRKQKAAWRAAGLCPRCGGKRLDPTRPYCLTCCDAIAARQRQYARRERVRMEAAREVCRQLGLCWRCRKPAEYGYNVCNGHRRKVV